MPSFCCLVGRGWHGVKGSSALGGRSLLLMSAMPRLCLPDFGLSLPLSPVNKMRWCWIGKKISGNKKRFVSAHLGDGGLCGESRHWGFSPSLCLTGRSDLEQVMQSLSFKFSLLSQG